jgi:hypothetical protein
MKDMIIACMLQMPECKGDVRSIKARILRTFGDHIKQDFINRTRSNSNLQEWEKTFLKTFSRYKQIFTKRKSVFFNADNDPAGSRIDETYDLSDI